MRRTKKFNEILLQYEATSFSSPRKSKLFGEMRKKAKSFSDWASVYQYAGDSIRKDAQREMERLVLRGKYASHVQLNILELFLIIDQSDKDEILRRYIKKYHKKDDLLFALSEASWGDDSDFSLELISKLQKLYKSYHGLDRGLNARERRSLRLLEEKSDFNPWCGESPRSRKGYLSTFFISYFSLRIFGQRTSTTGTGNW